VGARVGSRAAAHELAEIFLGRLPEIRRLLIRDVRRPFERRDPAHESV